VTLSGISIFHIGPPFWGLVFGVTTSWLVERATLQEAWQEKRDNNAVRHHRR
jgi:predicted benzoate:H+ symporter BenE